MAEEAAEAKEAAEAAEGGGGEGGGGDGGGEGGGGEGGGGEGGGGEGGGGEGAESQAVAEDTRPPRKRVALLNRGNGKVFRFSLYLAYIAPIPTHIALDLPLSLSRSSASRFAQQSRRTAPPPGAYLPHISPYLPRTSPMHSRRTT